MRLSLRPQISTSLRLYSQHHSHTLCAKLGASKYLFSHTPLTSCYIHLNSAVVILAAVLAIVKLLLLNYDLVYNL